MNIFRFGSLFLRQLIKPTIRKELSIIPKYKFCTKNDKLETEENKINDETELNNQDNREKLEINEELKMTDESKKLLEENIKLQEKIKLIEYDYKLSLAQTDNMIKRKYKEIEETKKFAIQSFSKDLFEVADILTLAIDSVPKEEIEKNNFLKSLFEGVLMTEKQLQTIFKRNGIVKIDPIGKKFDPSEHEAIIYVEDKTKEPNTIFTVNKVGYKLQNRVVRAASVGVIKE